jgi:hypothetical protein
MGDDALERVARHTVPAVFEPMQRDGQWRRGGRASEIVFADEEELAWRRNRRR